MVLASVNIFGGFAVTAADAGDVQEEGSAGGSGQALTISSPQRTLGSVGTKGVDQSDPGFGWDDGGL